MTDEFYKSYKWERLTEITSGCSFCKHLSSGECDGKESSKPCSLYKRRVSAGELCRHCDYVIPNTKNNNEGYCSAWHSEVMLDDYSCFAMRRRP